jgi:putative peptidoglycan lipid II flippase
VGDTWLEVAVRSYYANQDTRTPLVAAFLQVVSFIALSFILRPWIGLAGIPLAAALTFTTQALVLLSLLNRRYPGLLRVTSTFLRAVLGAILAGVLVFLVTRYLPLSPVLSSLLALPLGAAVAVPFIWPEVRALFHL